AAAASRFSPLPAPPGLISRPGVFLTTPRVVLHLPGLFLAALARLTRHASCSVLPFRTFPPAGPSLKVIGMRMVRIHRRLLALLNGVASPDFDDIGYG